MSQATTYDPALVVASFAGIPISGFADGTFVAVERNNDSYTLMVGAGGEAARSRSRNSSGKVTFTLMATSPVNDLLSAVWHADELLGTGVGAVIVKDMQGTTLCVANNAWIMKPPKVEYGKEISTREWVIECESIYMSPGGVIPLAVDTY
jgi:hypothetical protein